MAKISLSDIIFATISVRGKVMAKLRLDGVESYAQVLSHLLAAVKGWSGLATVSVRNSSQGWSVNRSVMLSR